MSNAPNQIWLDKSRNHQLYIFKMLVAQSRTGDRSLSSTLSFTHIFIRQILHQLITFILILLSSISITQFRQYNTNPIFIQHKEILKSIYLLKLACILAASYLLRYKCPVSFAKWIVALTALGNATKIMVWPERIGHPPC